MFNIEDVPTFTATVTVTAPGAGTQDFKATFEALDTDEAGKYDIATEAGTRAFVVRTLLAVSDIVGNDGNPVPDSPELRQRLVARQWCLAPLLKAYFGGIGAAISGN